MICRIPTGAGIYTITNNKNKKVYIGSTTNLRKRWVRHRTNLRGGRHRNSHLQSAWNKYGEKFFGFGILEYLDNLEELILAEQFWMDIYRLEGKVLYNYGKAARHPMLGRSPSEETRCKMRETRLGMCLTTETRRKIGDKHARPYPAFIHQITGEVIPAGVNLSAMCREHNIPVSNLHRVMTGKHKQCKGWELKEQMEAL